MVAKHDPMINQISQFSGIREKREWSRALTTDQEEMVLYSECVSCAIRMGRNWRLMPVMISNEIKRLKDISLTLRYSSTATPFQEVVEPIKQKRRVTFIDKIRVYVKGGTGGMGCPSAGGCGSKGGDVYVECAEGASLARYSTLGNRRHVAGHGTHFSKKKGEGKPGKKQVLTVPPGTIIYNEDKTVLRDMDRTGDRIIAAKGGQGGSQRTLNFNGMKGERKILTFELKLLGDVGLVGFPNAGKSTFLRSISNAAPKVADYPFTTLRPTIGYIAYPDHTKVSYTDLPGLIEDSHLNRGMGHQFLRHVERTKAVLMMVDINGFQLKETFPLRSPVESIALLLRELYLYQEEILNRKMVIALNKVDTDKEGDLVSRIKHEISSVSEEHLPFLQDEDREVVLRRIQELTANDFENIVPISAKNGDGLEKLTDKIRDVVEELRLGNGFEELPLANGSL